MSSAVQRWVQAFLGNVFSTLVATTNGLERQHQKLKYSHLNDSANGSLTDLLAVIVQSYVPSCHRRYYLALLFCQSATRVATSIFASESHLRKCGIYCLLFCPILLLLRWNLADVCILQQRTTLFLLSICLLSVVTCYSCACIIH